MRASAATYSPQRKVTRSQGAFWKGLACGPSGKKRKWFFRGIRKREIGTSILPGPANAHSGPPTLTLTPIDPQLLAVKSGFGSLGTQEGRYLSLGAAKDEQTRAG